MKPVENAVIAGRFRLNRLIQSGGMGSVWSATHLGLDIPCAVKFVKGNLIDDEQVLSRFEREAKSAAQLRSPHVVQMFEHGVFEGTPYIAMELLDGEDLDTRLRRGPLSAAELHKIMSEVCRALSKAHALGIVHRDLKPANIFIVKDGEHETTKVLDFGIAKTRSNELGGSTTKTGAMLGTPYYMSPEQAQGTKAVDFRSDLWSLAVIAFLSLTGRLPFQSEALGDLLMKIMVGPMPIPSQFGSVPPGFDRWWVKAAARDVAERFQSAKEFSDSLALACGVSQVSGIVDQSPVHIKPEVLVLPQETQRDTNVAIPLTQPSGPSAAASPAGGRTPPPLSRSLAAQAPVIPTSKPGLIVAIAIGAVLFATALIVVGWRAFREHESPTHANAVTTSSAPPAPSDTTAPAAPSASTAPASAESVSAAAPADSTPPVASSAPTSTRGAGHSQGASATGDHGKPTTTTTKPSTPSGTPARPASPSKTADPLGF